MAATVLTQYYTGLKLLRAGIRHSQHRALMNMSIVPPIYLDLGDRFTT